MTMLLFSLACLLRILPSYSAGLRTLESNYGISCCLQVAASLYQDPATGTLNGGESISCKTDPTSDPSGIGKMYHIDLPEVFAIENRVQIRQGNLCVHVPGGVVMEDSNVGSQILIPQGAKLSIIEPSNVHRRRMTVKTTGVSTVLALIIESPYNEQYSIGPLVSESIFGTESPTVVTVFRDCSEGKKTIRPATGTGITGGVATMTVDFDIGAYSVEASKNKIVASAEALYGTFGTGNTGSIDHLVICFPDADLNGFVSAAYVGGAISWYGVGICERVSLTAHELGHNLGLDHSSTFDNEYGDNSGYMGVGTYTLKYPAKCFNAANHWSLGWYKGRSREVNPTSAGAWQGTISAFAEVSSDYAIVKLQNLYMQYNAAKSFNAQTETGVNKLVVVMQHDKGTTLQAVLDSSNPQLAYNFNGRSYVIKVCRQYVSGLIDKMDVRIYDATAGQSSICPSAPIVSAPQLPNGISLCFSGQTTVQVKNKGIVKMNELKIGDEVMVANDTYDRVYSFGHRHETIQAEFLQLLPTGLEITKDHMVMVEGGHSVPALTIQIGDRLLLATGKLVTITGIGTVMRTGVYAPFTYSGTIVVSDVVASNYIAFQESERLVIGNWKTPLTYQWIAHASQAPHRIVARLCPNMIAETYTAQGVSHSIEIPLEMSRWLLQQNAFIMMLLLIPLLAIFIVLSAVDVLVSLFC